MRTVFTIFYVVFLLACSSKDHKMETVAIIPEQSYISTTPELESIDNLMQKCLNRFIHAHHDIFEEMYTDYESKVIHKGVNTIVLHSFMDYGVCKTIRVYSLNQNCEIQRSLEVAKECKHSDASDIKFKSFVREDKVLYVYDYKGRVEGGSFEKDSVLLERINLDTF